MRVRRPRVVAKGTLLRVAYKNPEAIKNAGTAKRVMRPIQTSLGEAPISHGERTV